MNNVATVAESVADIDLDELRDLVRNEVTRFLRKMPKGKEYAALIAASAGIGDIAQLFFGASSATILKHCAKQSKSSAEAIAKATEQQQEAARQLIYDTISEFKPSPKPRILLPENALKH